MNHLARRGTMAFVYPLLMLIFLAIDQTVHSQEQNPQSLTSLAEKIYLQTDGKVYTTDKTIWFKAIVAQAGDLIPSKLSGVLYVELIDPNEKISERKLIKIIDGLGDGFFELNRDYTEGLYQIRAYTEWNKNFGADFIYKEYIRIFSPANPAKANPIENVTLIEEQKNHRRVRVLFNPLLIDSQHTKDLNIHILLDDKEDSIKVRKDKSGRYLLEYPLTDTNQFINFRLLTKNDISYSRTILLTKNYVDLQFFPESGDWVHGLPALLGFKALDSIGKGKAVEGVITNSAGQIIANFKSNELGMGTVNIPIADSTQKYTARITSSGMTFPLPRVIPIGNILAVMKDGDNIRLRASSNYLLSDSLFVRASCRGVTWFDVKGRTKNGSLDFSLPSSSLPEGVIAFVLYNCEGISLCERLFFNERPASRIRISIATDKTTYTQRELSSLSIDTKDAEDKPVNANISVLVAHNDQLLPLQNTRENILSYFLLSSDLKGTIEHPSYYFEKDSNRFDALDALLLTQGWTKYNYHKEPTAISFQPEPSLLLSGQVTGGLFQKKQKKGTTLTLMTFGKPQVVDNQYADSLGRFSFSLDNQFQQQVNVLIQTNNKSGLKKDYTITLDKKTSPPISFEHLRTVEPPDNFVQSYVKKSINFKQTADAYASATDGITLTGVTVKGYAMTAERKIVTDRFGRPDLVIEGSEIQAKEAKWSYGLYSVLLFNFPDKIRVVRGSDGVLYARHLNNEITLVVVDGIPVMPESYNLIPSIPPSEVKTFEVIEHAKNFIDLFCELFPKSCANPPMTGNIIAIYTYGKSGIFGAKRAPGLTKASVPVFATPREFYAPKHMQLTPADWQKPDLRTLIHWVPNMQTDSLGQAKVSFYNGDLTGTTQIIVEAITPTGEIGYQRAEIEIRKKN